MSNNIQQEKPPKGLEAVNTNTVIQCIVKNIFLTILKKNNLDQNKLKKAYENIYNNSLELNDKEIVLPTYLIGPPGYGKSSIIKTAAQKVAESLNLNFIDNPSDDYTPSKNDFVFMTQALNNENKESDVVINSGFMEKLANRRISRLEQAGGSLLLLDDFLTNGIKNNDSLSLKEKKFKGEHLPNTYMCLMTTIMQNSNQSLNELFNTELVKENQVLTVVNDGTNVNYISANSFMAQHEKQCMNNKENKVTMSYK